MFVMLLYIHVCVCVCVCVCVYLYKYIYMYISLPQRIEEIAGLLTCETIFQTRGYAKQACVKQRFMAFTEEQLDGSL